MRDDQPRAAVWLDIPAGCDLRATFTADHDIEVRFGRPTDEVNLRVARPTLTRLVDIVTELLSAAPTERAE